MEEPIVPKPSNRGFIRQIDRYQRVLDLMQEWHVSEFGSYYHSSAPTYDYKQWTVLYNRCIELYEHLLESGRFNESRIRRDIKKAYVSEARRT